MRPIFVVGNKRSGTSHLVRLLNERRGIYVCPEADLLWLLYQDATGGGRRVYPDDGARAMQTTMKYCADLLSAPTPIRDRFFAIALRFRDSLQPSDEGSPSLPEWVGDKKPVQHADPVLRPFLYKCFPDARCLHIVRHPVAVVHSMLAQATDTMPWMHCWKRSCDALMAAWCRHEHWVLDMKREARVPVFSMTYSSLATEPTATIDRVMSFFELDDIRGGAGTSSVPTYADADAKYCDVSLRLSDDAQSLVDYYGLRL